MTLVNEADSDFGFEEIVAVAALGDPVGYPGLSTPAVRFLGRHLEQGPARALKAKAVTVIDRLFVAHAYDQAYYQRLLPICLGVGDLIARCEERDCVSARVVTSMLLAHAPAQLQARELSSWVHAFAQLVRRDVFNERDAEHWNSIVGFWIKDEARARALSPSVYASMLVIAERLKSIKMI